MNIGGLFLKELEYPFDAESVLKKEKSLKKQLFDAIRSNPNEVRTE